MTSMNLRVWEPSTISIRLETMTIRMRGRLQDVLSACHTRLYLHSSLGCAHGGSSPILAAERPHDAAEDPHSCVRRWGM